MFFSFRFINFFAPLISSFSLSLSLSLSFYRKTMKTCLPPLQIIPMALKRWKVCRFIPAFSFHYDVDVFFPFLLLSLKRFTRYQVFLPVPWRKNHTILEGLLYHCGGCGIPFVCCPYHRVCMMSTYVALVV